MHKNTMPNRKVIKEKTEAARSGESGMIASKY
jgi:hypothetical protein